MRSVRPAEEAPDSPGDDDSRAGNRRIRSAGLGVPARVRPALPVLADVVIPVVAYFALHGLGVRDVWALTVAGAATGVNAVVGTVRRRKLDGVGLLIAGELALGVALLFVTGDPRVVLAKPALYTALSGIYLLASCRFGQPLVYQAARPMATRGDPVRTVAYRLAWDNSAEFRWRERVITAGIGIALLVESVLRVVVVYSFSRAQIEESVLLSQVPGFALLVAVVVLIRTQVPGLRRLVDAEQERLSPTG